MSAEGQIKAFIDRILRLKEEQDVIGDDIRDIYAEAKGMGFDKTAMGNVVAHLRKVAKKGSETVAEQGAIFDIYLAAYEGHPPAPARVRENIEQFDPLTGEFLDDNLDPKLVQTIAMGVQTEIGRKVLTAAVDVMIEQEEAEEETHQRPSTNDEPSPEAGPQAEASPAGTGTGTLADREGRHDGEVASVDLPTNSAIASASQGEAEVPSAEAEPGAKEGGENVDRSAKRAGLEGGPVNLEPSGPEAERATSFTAKPPSPLRPHCRQPEACGGYGRNHCHTCAKAMREREPAERNLHEEDFIRPRRDGSALH
ncbi:GapR family DNA-binding domain-containing protein [Ensifer sp. ENS12]|uniref:DUF2312 domain-containing protein n=1 Tax=Ensifer sp. ENS12 TaxID=2854774 RepID=UPI000DE59CAA|nr:GapR family DNA-binding domain-containing protein [Ensifer sp. ENS12]MBV7522374.1 DUF2312 domain-containing protein [Ensifer sp. ENS12]